MIAHAWAKLQAGLWDRRAVRHPSPSYEDLIRKYAPGRSFLDVGGMWGVSGALSFLAEEVGATSVKLLTRCHRRMSSRQHDRRNSKVRVVRGALYAPETPDLVGRHDLVWCTGVLYHAPAPTQAMERLDAMMGELLVVGTKVIPEVPGLAQASVLYPGLDSQQRALHRVWGGGGS